MNIKDLEFIVKKIAICFLSVDDDLNFTHIGAAKIGGSYVYYVLDFENRCSDLSAYLAEIDMTKAKFSGLLRRKVDVAHIGGAGF